MRQKLFNRSGAGSGFNGDLLAVGRRDVVKIKLMVYGGYDFGNRFYNGFDKRTH